MGVLCRFNETFRHLTRKRASQDNSLLFESLIPVILRWTYSTSRRKPRLIVRSSCNCALLRLVQDSWLTQRTNVGVTGYWGWRFFLFFLSDRRHGTRLMTNATQMLFILANIPLSSQRPENILTLYTALVIVDRTTMLGLPKAIPFKAFGSANANGWNYEITEWHPTRSTWSTMNLMLQMTDPFGKAQSRLFRRWVV